MDALLDHLQFLEPNQDLSLALTGSYNLFLVALSVIVACLAAYSALRIVGRINAAPTLLTKSLWLLAGASTMGIGVWAMHFVGMLAFILPIAVGYNPAITLFSMLPSILASGVMLVVISHDRIGIGRLLLGGTLMGAGIGVMHYTGMYAMQMDAVMLYDLPLFLASIVVAVVLASVALYTKFLVGNNLESGRNWTQVVAAIIMGLAVAGMHYTGMAAAYFFPGNGTHTTHTISTAVDPLWLGAWVTLISVLIIGIAIFITMMDQRLEISRKHGEKLETLVAGRTQELQAANAQLQVELEQRRQAQEALSIAKEAAEAATQAKAEFLANMSHEIRTPLNAIVGMTELLMDTPLVNEQRDFTDTIRTSSESLLNVINDILDFSKIEAHKLELENQPLDLHKCVEEALDMMVIKASEKHLELAYLAEDDTPTTILGDITRLRQILINLLNNAIKFTDAGEVVVTVESTRLPARYVPDTLYELDEQDDTAAFDWYELHFSVRDTGIGIPPERMERLFQSFSQIDASTTRKYGGTGLGLIISQRLSELMGGRMWVESDGQGHGSTFHFTIQAQIVTAQLPTYIGDTTSLLRGKRGLFVDDNAISRRIVVRQLEKWGIHTRAVASAAEALTLIRDGEKVDFAILDLYMPEMDGFALARELRQHPHGAKLPLIMLSSIGDKSVHAEAQTLNFVALLAKPLKQTQLSNVLMEIFGKETPLAQPTAHLSSFDHTLAERMPLRILLAEDNLVNQKVAQHMLARLGYSNIHIVGNGVEAVHELHRQPYDVVLMDVQMPEMDGLEATRVIISEWPAGQRPYIIAMTAHALTGDEARCMEAGMNGYVSKPIQIDKLVAALKQSQQTPPMTENA
jgi:signal transduction histidine kinase/DNA-binding response OmpR family regulator